MIDGFKKLSYLRRLKLLTLTTLETRRLRAEIIQVFKIFEGFGNLHYSELFVLSNTKLRVRDLKLFKNRFGTNTGTYVFCNRVVDVWNDLPDDAISGNTLNLFKTKLDRYLRNCRELISGHVTSFPWLVIELVPVPGTTTSGDRQVK